MSRLEFADRRWTTVLARRVIRAPACGFLLLLSAAAAWAGIHPKAEGDPPVIREQPIARTISEEGHATLSARAEGSAALSYQWWKDGTSLTNDSRVSGVTGAVLNIDPAYAADSGDYTVVVNSASGSVTSSVTALVVSRLIPSLTPLGSTGVLVRINGQRGDVYRLEVSVNFGPWLTNGYVTNFDGQALFLDQPMGGGIRQLRARFEQMLPVLESVRGPDAPGRFRTYGKLNQVWRIEATPDFTQWETLATVTNLTGWTAFADPTQPLPERRFYRIAPP